MFARKVVLVGCFASAHALLSEFSNYSGTPSSRHALAAASAIVPNTIQNAPFKRTAARSSGWLQQDAGATGNQPKLMTSQKLWMGSLDGRWVIVFVCGILTGVAAIVISISLALQHYWKSSEDTGTLAMDPQAVLRVRFILAVPMLALTGILGLLLPTCHVIWDLIGQFVTAANFMKIPEYVFAAIGGPVHVMMHLKNGMVEGKALPDVEMYSHYFCFNSTCCCQARTPTMQDARFLKLMIVTNCLATPALALLQCALELEFANGASFATTWLKYLVEGLGIAKIPLVLMCASACSGLVQLATALSPTVPEQIRLSKVLLYCRTYLLAMNILPIVVGQILGSTVFELRSGAVISSIGALNIGVALTVCVMSLLSAIVARTAFPIPNGGSENLTEKTGSTSKRIQYCPFCGSNSLEPHTTAVNLVACAACGAQGFPHELEGSYSP